MDEKKLKEFTKKRTKLIGSLMSSMQEQVVENQRKVYERMLDKFIDKLEKDEDGNVKNNDHNRRLLNEIDEVFKEYNKKEGRQTIELLLQSVTSIMSFNQGYFQALDGNARTLKIMPKVKDFMKGWLGIKGDVVEPNGYLDKLIANDPAKIAVKNTAMKVVIGQEGFENAKKQFQKLIDGNKDTLGAFEKHQRNFAFDLYSQIDRATSDTIRADLGFVFAIYEGGLIETSRIFCEEHNGNVYHISEIKDFNPTEAKPPNYNPITDLGGYGCRHHLNWISTALAKAMGKDVNKFLKGILINEKKTKNEEEKEIIKPKEEFIFEKEKEFELLRGDTFDKGDTFDELSKDYIVDGEIKNKAGFHFFTDSEKLAKIYAFGEDFDPTVRKNKGEPILTEVKTDKLTLFDYGKVKTYGDVDNALYGGKMTYQQFLELTKSNGKESRFEDEAKLEREIYERRFEKGNIAELPYTGAILSDFNQGVAFKNALVKNGYDGYVFRETNANHFGIIGNKFKITKKTNLKKNN